MLKKVLIILAGFAVVIVAVGFVLPTDYRVERSRLIPAPQTEVFALINDFEQWPRWDPWARRDKTMKYTYEGTSGVGAVQRYESAESGTGRIEIVESAPPERVVIEMDFGGGPSSRPRSTFVLTPVEGGTRVTWTMVGETTLRPIGSYFGLLMDGMVGPDFEAGLTYMEAAVKGEGAAGE